MRILNLYAGTGGNRRLWSNEHEITAVEINCNIAKIYASEFPNDNVRLEDAHQFLLDHYKEFDFIWSSPPCPTHSQVNNFLNAQGVIRYPDMSLWQEIIFLKHFCKVPYCVENVKSYYEPLIPPQRGGRHYFWANFIIPQKKIDEVQIGRMNGPKGIRQEYEHDPLKRNEVNSQLGLDIFNAASKQKQVHL